MSLQSLRARGHYDRYLRELPEEHKPAILDCVAGLWLPIEIARGHYGACDRLALSVDEMLAMGGAVGERAQGSLLATVVKAAKGIGTAFRGVLLGILAMFASQPYIHELPRQPPGCAAFRMQWV